MNAYYDAIEGVFAKDGGRIIIALIGVSGSGKTTLAQQLVHRYDKEVCTVLSLDAIREELNGGVYPKKESYQRIHKLALPLYHERLQACESRIIIIDNTNLRFYPDIDTILRIASKKQYHFLTMTPPLSEYGLTTWRPNNAHNVAHETFLNMISRWPRKTFDEFIYKLVAPQDALLLGSHIKDINVPRHIYVKQWGRGCLYILGQYIGYMDADIARAVIMSGKLMTSVGASDLFLNKTPPIHMTLYFRSDRSIKLADIIERLVASTSEPPALHFSGVHHIKQLETENDLWFLTITEESQEDWAQLFQQVGYSFHQNLHVTLGYTHTDQHDIEKCVVPAYSMADMVSCDNNNEFVPQYRGKYEAKISFTASVSAKELVNLQCHSSLPERNAYLTNLRWFNGHRHTALRWRRSGDVSLCMIKVKSGIDDEAYQSDTRLLTLLPRGLCYVFVKDALIGLVFPTNKFFGDEDDDDGVTVMDETNLTRDTTMISQKMIVTEKANGEMFTVTCFKNPMDSESGSTYLFVLGSKNNKFPVQCDVAVIGNLTSIYAMIEQFLTPKERLYFQAYRKQELPHSRKWFTDRMWIEMTLVFFKQLAAIDVAKRLSWCQRMSDGNITACGEFETANHPHLIQFADGHEHICFFALTTHNANGEPVQREECALSMMEEFGFHTVKRYAKTIRNVEEMLAFRQQIWRREYSEGVVLHILNESGALGRMVKLKTMWYVGYRGIRERLRRFQGRWHLKENEDKMKSQVCDVALSKLKFFKFENDADLTATRELWKARAKAVVERLIAIARQDVAEAALTFQYNYPILLVNQ